MTIATVWDKFTPRLAIFDECITTMNERIEATTLSTATMLRSEFAQKFSKLSERISTTDDTLKATMDTKAAPGLSELEASVRILKLCPSVDLASNPLLPHENPTGNVISPARPHGNPPAACPRVNTTFSLGVCFEPDGISVEERARNAWAGSPSGHNAGAQVPDPRPQPPSEISQNPPQLATPPRNHPVASHDTAPTPGGPIVSPRQGDCEGQARRLGASWFDIVRLATPDYHIGTHGVAVLTHAILVKCGYNQIVSSDVVTCHNNIIAVHRRVRELWYNPSTHTYGPQVERIVTKSLKLLPTLDSATTETMVDFYDRLQESATGLAIAIMPFDMVMIKNGLIGLCIPGLGVNKYHVMSKALMELLPRLISGNLSPQINAALASVRSESGNGYNFLWRVLELTVPGFNPMIPIQVPQWSNTDDIFSFAQAYLLHFCLQGKMNFHYSDRTRAGIFLHAIQSSEFANTVTMLQSHVNSYWEPYDDNYLPPHLRIHGLATSIHHNNQARMRDVFSLQVWRLLTTSPGLVQGIPTARRLDRDSRDCATSCTGGDGFCDGGGGFRDGGGGGGFRDGGGGFCDGGDSPFLKDTHSGRRGDNSRTMPDRPRPRRGRGQLAQPDRNRRPFLPDVQCAACKKVGHVAKHCNMLATAICLERYMKHNLSHSVRDAIEKDWLERWKERLGNPDGMPRQVMRAYVEDLDIMVARLDDEMEWDCWANDPALGYESGNSYE